jgi:hypothetical protein
LSTVFGVNSFLVEYFLQYFIPKVLIFFSILYHGGKAGKQIEYSGFLDRQAVIHEIKEVKSFSKVIYVFDFKS